MKRIFLYTLTLMVASTGISACSWAGKTTGKAVNAVEQGAAEFGQGYQKERSTNEKEQPANEAR